MTAAPSSAAAAASAVAVDLTATQFVILSENQRKKAALATTKDAFSRLQAENQVLLQQLEDSTRESYSVSEHFRQELLAKNQHIAQLQAQFEQLRASSEARAAQLQAQAAAREADMQAEFEALSTEMMQRIEEQQEQLQGLQEYQQQKAVLESSMAGLREEAVGLRETLEAQRTQLERHYAGLNAKMRKEYEQKLEELKRAQEEELEGRLDAGVRRILAANRRMAEELRLHITESDALQSEVSLLTAERARLNRELGLKAELEAGWAVRAGQQASALKEAQAKVSALERSLQQVMSDFVAERASVVAAASSQVTHAASEVDALRRLLRLKGRELKQLRALAQEVLLQRSEVEIFLLSSLHQVRLAINKDRSGGPVASGTALPPAAAATAAAAAADQTLTADAAPHLSTPQHAATEAAGGRCLAADEQRPADSSSGGGDGGGGRTGPAGTFDIRDLSWVDRERVLRLLFAKISGRAAEQRSAPLPPHPLAAPAYTNG